MDAEYDWFWEETDVFDGESERSVEEEAPADGETGNVGQTAAES